MTYSEIVRQAGIYFSSALDLEFVLTVLNSEASKLWAKNSYINMDYDKIVTVADQAAYTVDTGCIVSKIQDKILLSDDATLADANFTIYTKQMPTDVVIRSSSWYPISSTKIGLYPVPDTSGYYIIVPHNKKPTTITMDNYDTLEPEFDSAFHELLVHGLVSELASMETNIDIEIAINAIRKYNGIYSDMVIFYKPSKIKNTFIHKTQGATLLIEIAKTL